MTKRATFQMLTALALGLGGATVVQATPIVTDWGYTVTTNWGTAGNGAPAPTFSSGGGEQFVNSTQLSWGASKTGTNDWATLKPTDGGGDSGDARSGLEITPGAAVTSPPAPNLVTNGPAADSHTITHYNYAISNQFAALTTASVFTTLSLSPLLPAPPYGSGTLPTLSRTFQVNFIETPNVDNCGFTSASECDDIFVVQVNDLMEQFDFNGHTYTLQIVANGLGPLSAGACTAAGVSAGCFGLQTLEGQATAAQFGFLISTPVPEPGTLGLLGLGLAGFGFFGRRLQRRRS